jgi:hypothetical protein
VARSIQTVTRQVTAWVRQVHAEMRELHERRALVDRPWEEDYLHWVRDGQGWQLHGHLLPPRRRHTSVTSAGWCLGLSGAVDLSSEGARQRTNR